MESMMKRLAFAAGILRSFSPLQHRRAPTMPS
jgi:hypothetical protein